MIIHAPISVGELIDKITILSIKQQYTEHKNKLINIQNELQSLMELADTNGIDCESDQEALYTINHMLWQVEDQLRDCERKLTFDDNFIELARKVYIYNDQRAVIKREINMKYQSEIIEEKIYQ
jgi:predicted nuclease with TOPRIM domain